MTLKTVNLKPRIGTEVIAEVDQLLSGDHAEELRDLLDQRGILLFRRINLSAEQQLAFSQTLGTVENDSDFAREGVVTISMDKNVMKGADYFKGSFLWHFDGSVREVPPLASLLSALTLPETGGGETEFANTSAAYEDLPDEEKAAYDKVRVLHSLASEYRRERLEPSDAILSYWKQASPKPRSHPLVWRHKSGRKSLVVGSTATEVEGGVLDDALPFRLLEWVTQPQYVYRHSWEVGDLIIYDNTGVLHRAMPYDPNSGRVLQRTKLVGEEACA